MLQLGGQTRQPLMLARSEKISFDFVLIELSWQSILSTKIFGFLKNCSHLFCSLPSTAIYSRMPHFYSQLWPLSWAPELYFQLTTTSMAFYQPFECIRLFCMSGTLPSIFPLLGILPLIHHLYRSLLDFVHHWDISSNVTFWRSLFCYHLWQVVFSEGATPHLLQIHYFFRCSNHKLGSHLLFCHPLSYKRHKSCPLCLIIFSHSTPAVLS